MKAMKKMIMLAAALTLGLSAWAQAPQARSSQKAGKAEMVQKEQMVNHETVGKAEKMDAKAPHEQIGAKKSSSRVVTVTSSNVRLRKTASSKAASHKEGGKPIVLKKGAKLTYLGTSGNYYKVSYNGVTGYISKKYGKVSYKKK